MMLHTNGGELSFADLLAMAHDIGEMSVHRICPGKYRLFLSGKKFGMGYGHLHCLARCFFLPHVQLQGCPPNPSLSRTPQIEKVFQNVADDMYIPHHWKNMWLAVAVMVWKRPTKEAPIHLILLGRCPIISHYIPLQVLKPHCNRHSVPLVSHHLPMLPLMIINDLTMISSSN